MELTFTTNENIGDVGIYYAKKRSYEPDTRWGPIPHTNSGSDNFWFYYTQL